MPVCGGVFRKFLKISSTYIGKFSSLCGGVSANFFKKSSYYYWTLLILFGGVFLEIFGNLFPIYYYWTLPGRYLMVCEKLFSLRQRSPHYIWTTESKNFVFFRKEISLYYNWKLPARKLTVCAKLFSLRQRFFHFMWAIEDKNFYVSVSYPQYYWKVSIALPGVFRKNFYCPPTTIGNFHCKTSYFSQKKNAPHLYWKLDSRFYKVFKKKVA